MTNKVYSPSSYEIGNPAVNLMLAVLRQARADEGTEYENEMWVEFKGTELYRDGLKGIPDALEVAWWVALYIKFDGE